MSKNMKPLATATLATRTGTVTVQPLDPNPVGDSVILPAITEVEGTGLKTSAVLAELFRVRAEKNALEQREKILKKALNLPTFTGGNRSIPVYIQVTRSKLDLCATINVQFRAGYEVAPGHINVIKEA
jgi:hypothetical protein